METFFIYLLKSAGIVTLFYCCYFLFLRNDTFFKSNRLFLVSGIITSIFLPLVTITKTIVVKASPISTDNFNTGTTFEQTQEPFNWWLIVTLLYTLMSIIFLTRFLKQLWTLHQLKKNGTIIKDGAFIFVENDKIGTPYSFYNHIFYNSKSIEGDSLQTILKHEKAHAKQKHSIDVLLIEILLIVQWFNPFIWLYRKALKDNLEFLADMDTAAKNKKEYQFLLLKQATGLEKFPVTNSFYNSSIKKRIVMLNQNQSKKMNQFKLVFILPLLSLFLVSFNIEKEYVLSNDSETVLRDLLDYRITKATTNSQLNKIKTELAKESIDFSYTAVRNNAGQIINIKIHLKKDDDTRKVNKKYKSKSDEPIEDIILTYNKDDKSLFLGKSEENDGNKNDVITSVAWDKKDKNKAKSNLKNHNTESHVDVTTHSETHTETRIETSEEGPVMPGVNTNGDNTDPMVFIDGVKASHHEMRLINPADIESVNVLKGESAIAVYGPEGEKGAILVTTKKSAENTPAPTISISGSNKKNAPLVYIDGNEASRQEFEALDDDEIATVNVLKNASATEIYGLRAKNGVIEITTKTGQNKDTVMIAKDKNTIYTNKPAMDNDKEKQYTILPTTTDAELDALKATITADGGTLTINKIKRNKDEHITVIHMNYTANGNSNTMNFNNNSGNVTIVFGLNEKGGIFSKSKS